MRCAIFLGGQVSVEELQVVSLEFAMLAEFARTDSGGLLTVVNGGFERLQIKTLGLVHQFYLVMKFRQQPTDEAVFSVLWESPGESPFAMNVSGRTSRVVVVGIGVPLFEPGAHSIRIEIDGKAATSLPLHVALLDETVS